MEEVIEDKRPTLIKYIDERTLNQNKSFVMIFVGQTGSGKSYSALRLCEILDPEFNMDRVAFTALEFMKIINDLNARKKAGEEIKGRVVLWDEFGVEHNSREAMSKRNRVINYFFQTSRNLNLVVIMTVPMLSFIDSATRKLIHAVAEMTGISKHDKVSTCKVKMVQANAWSGKEYAKYLRYKTNGKQRLTKNMKFELPSKDILKAYEDYKTEFTTELNKDILGDLVKEKHKSKPKNIVLTSMQKQVFDSLLLRSPEQTAKLLDRSLSVIYEHKKVIESKGIVFVPVYQGNKIQYYKMGNSEEILAYERESPIQVNSFGTSVNEEQNRKVSLLPLA